VDRAAPWGCFAEKQSHPFLSVEGRIGERFEMRWRNGEVRAEQSLLLRKFSTFAIYDLLELAEIFGEW